MGQTLAHVRREEHANTRWEFATRTPSAALAPYVRELQGYVEQTPGLWRRREYPGLQVVVILEFEPRLRLYPLGHGTDRTYTCYRGGFVAGVDDTFTLTEHLGFQSGIQLNLHPLGARRLFGLPLHTLNGTAIAFADLVPKHARLAEQLAELPDWDTRFDALEGFLTQRLQDAAPENAYVAWALRRIASSSADLQPLHVEQLARELGYSHKHVIALFRDQVGVSPKLWMRLVRFERLQQKLRHARPSSLAQLANECGYYDQAHLARDVQQFTGASPSQLIREHGSDPRR